MSRENAFPNSICSGVQAPDAGAHIHALGPDAFKCSTTFEESSRLMRRMMTTRGRSVTVLDVVL